jgi:hypothetical protein
MCVLILCYTCDGATDEFKGLRLEVLVAAS